MFFELRNDIQTLRRVTELPMIPLLIKGEIEHIEHLPLPYLRNLSNLIIVGYHGEDVASTLPRAKFLSPPFDETTTIPRCTLLFLSEYHVISMLRKVIAFPASRHDLMLVPFAGDFIEEVSMRRILHELGYAEICWLDYDRTDQSLVVSGISHPIPISCMPVMVTPTHTHHGGTRWLRASRVVLENCYAD